MDLLGSFWISLMAFAQAATPVSYGVDQDTNYFAYIRDSINETAFSTDVGERVAAAQVAAAANGTLEVFIANPMICLSELDEGTHIIPYSIIVRNSTDSVISNIEISFKADTLGKAGNVVHTDLRDYNIGDLAPGEERVIQMDPSLVLERRHSDPADDEFQGMNSFATAEGLKVSDLTLIRSNTNHSLSNKNCEVRPEFPEVWEGPIKKNIEVPSICDISDTTCQESLPQNLGPRFEVAKKPEQQVQSCSKENHPFGPFDPRNPCRHDEIPATGVGPRYQKARPKIVPGNCSVEEDTLKVSPQVEKTFCESGGGYRETLLRERGQAPAKPVKPPQIIPDILFTDDATRHSPYLIPRDHDTINQRLNIGDACAQKPGDPWWAPDCSCNCEQIVRPPNSDPRGGIKFCSREQFKRENRVEYEKVERAGLIQDDDGILPITSHDIWNFLPHTKVEECLSDRPARLHPDFGGLRNLEL